MEIKNHIQGRIRSPNLVEKKHLCFKDRQKGENYLVLTYYSTRRTNSTR